MIFGPKKWGGVFLQLRSWRHIYIYIFILARNKTNILKTPIIPLYILKITYILNYFTVPQQILIIIRL
jgi:hypothetical protein